MYNARYGKPKRKFRITGDQGAAKRKGLLPAIGRLFAKTRTWTPSDLSSGGVLSKPRLSRLSWSSLCLAAVVLCLDLSCRRQSSTVQLTDDLSGIWTSDDGGLYYVQQTGDVLWWAGLSTETGGGWNDFHRGVRFTSVFHGSIHRDPVRQRHRIVGDWAHIPKGTRLGYGTLTLEVQLQHVSPGELDGAGIGPIDFNGDGKPDFFPRGSRHTPGGDYVESHKVQSTGSGLDASVWWRAGASPVMTTDDIFALTRRNDELSMGEHLRPYKDDVVVFGRIAEGPGVGFPHNTAHQPHPTGLGSPVDFTGPPIVETYPFMMCASTGVNKYKWFLGNGDPPDGDLNLDVYVPILDRIDSLGESSSFWASPEGWLRNRDQIRAKLEAQVRDHGFLRPNQKIHLELIMFGKRFDEDHCEADGESLLPGWADFNANSVLLNGRPINTHVQRDNTPSCQAIFFNSKSGCPVSNILGKALPTDSPKIHIRVAGALALDQRGGSFEEDDPQTNNVEIHPVYSLDIIDPDLINTTNATGTWAGSDAGTYYIRQVRDRSGQDIVWWLGVSRDRGRTLTTVFRGRLDADRIVGDWAAVPLGGSRQNGTLSLNLQRQGLSAATEAEGLTMVLRRDAESGGFPAVKMEKLYAPDFFAPEHTGRSDNFDHRECRQ